MSPAKKDAEYWRAYREKRKSTSYVVTAEDARPLRDNPLDEAQTTMLEKLAQPLEHRMKRQQAESREWRNPYDDGLPDWPELIQNVSQYRRDRILSQPSISTRRREH